MVILTDTPSPPLSQLISQSIRQKLYKKLPSKLDNKVINVSIAKKILSSKINFTLSKEQYSSSLNLLKAKYGSLSALNNQKNKSNKNMNDSIAYPFTILENIADGIPNPKIVIFPSEKLEMKWSAGVIGSGLANVGNTCYLNSTLQCLTYTPPLANYFIKFPHSERCHIHGFCMECEIGTHIKFSLSKVYNVYKPLNILRNLKNIAKHFNMYKQEDAHEFFIHILEAMSNSGMNGYNKLDAFSKQTTLVNQIFGGYIRSRVTCKLCQKPSDCYDPFVDISLDIKGTYNLGLALRRFINPEIIQNENAYKCENCKRKVPAIKRVTIHRPPRVCVFHLKRFTCAGNKITQFFEYPERFNMAPYLSNCSDDNCNIPDNGLFNGSSNHINGTFKFHSSQNSSYLQQQQKQHQNISPAPGSFFKSCSKNTGSPPLWYSLYAVLVHSGYSTNYGHYFCYCKGQNGFWYRMDDANVTQSNIQKVLTQEAYLLFYIQETPHTTLAFQPSISTSKMQPQPKPTNLMTNGFMSSSSQESLKSNGISNTLQPHLSRQNPPACQNQIVQKVPQTTESTSKTSTVTTPTFLPRKFTNPYHSANMNKNHVNAVLSNNNSQSVNSNLNKQASASVIFKGTNATTHSTHSLPKSTSTQSFNTNSGIISKLKNDIMSCAKQLETSQSASHLVPYPESPGSSESSSEKSEKLDTKIKMPKSRADPKNTTSPSKPHTNSLFNKHASMAKSLGIIKLHSFSHNVNNNNMDVCNTSTNTSTNISSSATSTVASSSPLSSHTSVTKTCFDGLLNSFNFRNHGKTTQHIKNSTSASNLSRENTLGCNNKSSTLPASIGKSSFLNKINSYTTSTASTMNNTKPTFNNSLQTSLANTKENLVIEKKNSHPNADGQNDLKFVIKKCLIPSSNPNKTSPEKCHIDDDAQKVYKAGKKFSETAQNSNRSTPCVTSNGAPLLLHNKHPSDVKSDDLMPSHSPKSSPVKNKISSDNTSSPNVSINKGSPTKKIKHKQREHGSNDDGSVDHKSHREHRHRRHHKKDRQSGTEKGRYSKLVKEPVGSDVGITGENFSALRYESGHHNHDHSSRYHHHQNNHHDVDSGSPPRKRKHKRHKRKKEPEEKRNGEGSDSHGHVYSPHLAIPDDLNRLEVDSHPTQPSENFGNLLGPQLTDKGTRQRRDSLQRKYKNVIEETNTSQRCHNGNSRLEANNLPFTAGVINTPNGINNLHNTEAVNNDSRHIKNLNISTGHLLKHNKALQTSVGESSFYDSKINGLDTSHNYNNDKLGRKQFPVTHSLTNGNNKSIDKKGFSISEFLHSSNSSNLKWSSKLEDPKSKTHKNLPPLNSLNNDLSSTFKTNNSSSKTNGHQDRPNSFKKPKLSLPPYPSNPFQTLAERRQN